jgi:hypothetical protein
LNPDALHGLFGLRQSLTCAFVPPVTKQDIQDLFGTHGTGSIKEIKLMNGFGFIEYEDPMDARDVVPGRMAPIFPLIMPGELIHLTAFRAHSSVPYPPCSGLA